MFMYVSPCLCAGQRSALGVTHFVFNAYVLSVAVCCPLAEGRVSGVGITATCVSLDAVAGNRTLDLWKSSICS